MSHDGHTISLPECEEHPPLKQWPWKNLIQGVCPACGRHVWPLKTIRELRARRIIEKREGR